MIHAAGSGVGSVGIQIARLFGARVIATAASDVKLAKARDEVVKAGGDPKTALEKLSPVEQKVHEASITGDRKTLKVDSFIPGTMAVIYLLMLIYFKTIGGYKPVHLAGTKAAETGAGTAEVKPA